SLPTSWAVLGVRKRFCGKAGFPPITPPSPWGSPAAVKEPFPPPQPSPAVIQTIWTSLTPGGRSLNVDSVVAIIDPLPCQSSTIALLFLSAATFTWQTPSTGKRPRLADGG